MTTTPRIVVLGSLNMDLVGTVADFPAPGETILGSTFTTLPGGKGGNQAVAAARAGARVTVLAAVGTDDFGTALAGHLQAEGIDGSALRRENTASGIALITVAESGENTIVVIPGANGVPHDLNQDETGRLDGAALLVAQLEIPVPRVLAAFRRARERGVTTLLNVSPAADLPDELWPLVDIAVVNEHEEQALGGALATVPHLVVTLGGDGARYTDPQGVTTEVPTIAVTPVDTTGAGDAFAGALSAEWARGVQPQAAIRYACVAGALATTVPGAGSCAPTDAQIRSRIG